MKGRAVNEYIQSPHGVHTWVWCAGGRRKPVPKVTITELNRRLTREPKDFQEVMEQARRVSQGGEM